MKRTLIFVAFAFDTKDSDEESNDDDRSGSQRYQEPCLMVEGFLVRITVLQVQFTGRHELSRGTEIPTLYDMLRDISIFICSQTN